MDSLIKQADQNKSHSHSGKTGTESQGHTHTINSGNTSSSGTLTTAGFRGVEGTVNVSGGNHRHSLLTKGNSFNVGSGSGTTYNWISGNSDYSGDLSMSGKFTPSGYLYGKTDGVSQSHTHTISSDGGTEARPENYSIRLWKRVS